MTIAYRDDLVTPKQARAYFDVCSDTLLRWETQGLLPSVRTAGNQRRYSMRSMRLLRYQRACDSARKEAKSCV